MIAPIVLLAIGVLAGYGGSQWLNRSTWTRRSPGLGIIAWLAVGLSTLLSVVLAGLALAVPQLPASEGVADFFHACSAALRAHYATPGGGTVAFVGGAAAAILLVRFSVRLTRDLQAGWRGRARQGELLDIVGRSHSEPDVLVIDHPTPAAYCLPGRSRQIVITQGALSVLTDRELRQVLAHERAHLRSRHHLALLLAGSIETALFGRLGTLLLADAVAELIEMHADDAADHHHRADLSRALVLLAREPLPAGALGAVSSCAMSRVRRLAEPTLPLGAGQRWGVFVLSAAVLALPVAIAIAPGLNAILLHYCPVTA